MKKEAVFGFLILVGVLLGGIVYVMQFATFDDVKLARPPQQIDKYAVEEPPFTPGEILCGNIENFHAYGWSETDQTVTCPNSDYDICLEICQESAEDLLETVDTEALLKCAVNKMKNYNNNNCMCNSCLKDKSNTPCEKIDETFNGGELIWDGQGNWVCHVQASVLYRATTTIDCTNPNEC